MLRGPLLSVSAIVVMDRDHVIGRQGQLPWHLPSDLARFKRFTLGHPVIMGRTTFDSIVAKLGGPLPKRTNIVLTSKSREDVVKSGAFAAASTEEALERAGRSAGAGEIFILGGSSVYRQMLPSACRLYVTRVDTCTHGGDAHFPHLNWQEWRERREGKLMAAKHDPKDEYESSFSVYERK